MSVFLLLLIKIFPLYIIIFLGFLAGKFLSVNKEAIARLLIYIIAPIIVFNGVVTTKISLSSLSLPLLFFCICTGMCLLFLKIGGYFWKDSTRNILAFTAGSGNTGYFGLPVALAIFNQQLFGLAVLSLLGFILFENSVGFFVTAKGHHSAKEAVRKVIKLPSIYAFLLGLFLNLFAFKMGSNITDAVTNFRGAYTILGMMIIGLGLSSITHFRLDLKFIGLSFIAKFLIWPAIILFIILLDNNLLKIYDANIHKVMILMAIVPLAANTVVYATELKAQPEKASLAVLLSTIFALFYIPLIAMWYLK